jgi:M2.ncuI DNA methyltransferase
VFIVNGVSGSSLHCINFGAAMDPFAGSGTTLKIAKSLGRNYIGYELYSNYRELIDKKLDSVERGCALAAK